MPQGFSFTIFQLRLSTLNHAKSSPVSRIPVIKTNSNAHELVVGMQPNIRDTHQGRQELNSKRKGKNAARTLSADFHSQTSFTSLWQTKYMQNLRSISAQIKTNENQDHWLYIKKSATKSAPAATLAAATQVHMENFLAKQDARH